MVGKESQGKTQDFCRQISIRIIPRGLNTRREADGFLEASPVVKGARMKPKRIVQHPSNSLTEKKKKTRKHPEICYLCLFSFCSRNVAVKCPNTFLEKEGLQVVSNGCLMSFFLVLVREI